MEEAVLVVVVVEEEDDGAIRLGIMSRFSKYL